MIILERSFGPIARAIHAGMFTWLVTRLRKPQKIYNHAEIYINDIVSGALAKGVTNRSYEEAFGDGKRRELLFYDMNLNEEQETKLYEFCIQQEGKPYEYLNFAWHTVRIFSIFFTGTDIWIGKKRKAAMNRIYCIEHGANGVNVAFPKVIKRPWRMNPVEFKEFCDRNFTLMINSI